MLPMAARPFDDKPSDTLVVVFGRRFWTGSSTLPHLHQIRERRPFGRTLCVLALSGSARPPRRRFLAYGIGRGGSASLQALSRRRMRHRRDEEAVFRRARRPSPPNRRRPGRGSRGRSVHRAAGARGGGARRPGSRCADRVAEGDRATIDVHLVPVEAELPAVGDDLGAAKPASVGFESDSKASIGSSIDPASGERPLSVRGQPASVRPPPGA